MRLIINKVLKLVRSVKRGVQSVASSLGSDGRTVLAQRAAGLTQLNLLSRCREVAAVPAARKVLVDGLWDNANYWTRFAIVRRALALDGAVEVGILGQYSRKRSRAAFAAFGISEVIDLKQRSRPRRYLGQAKNLLKGINSANELLQLSLPMDFPSNIYFDGVLMRQRRSTVDITDPDLPIYLAELLAGLEAANEILVNGEFDLVILSHPLDYTFGAIAWAAIGQGIRVLTLYGDYGHTKFFQLKKPEDLFMYPSRPTLTELGSMSEERALSLRTIGSQLLAARLGGRTTDVGAIFAYQKRQGSTNREEIAKRFSWETSKPIIGVYNSNWFDYPHSQGLNDFRDFLDWILTTLEIAKTRPEINWLFKAHPCDDWYAKINGQRLSDLVAEIDQPHIQLADKNWNGSDLMRSLDGIVTCHGTIGIEATSQSIPVLVPYTGWYGHAGFVSCAKSREDYINRLQTSWWQKQDLNVNREKAELFAGWVFCVPEWYANCVFPDDSRQDEIYLGLDEFLQSNRAVLARESDEIAAWYADGHPYYHVFVMMGSRNFQLGNLR